MWPRPREMLSSNKREQNGSSIYLHLYLHLSKTFKEFQSIVYSQLFLLNVWSSPLFSPQKLSAALHSSFPGKFLPPNYQSPLTRIFPHKIFIQFAQHQELFFLKEPTDFLCVSFLFSNLVEQEGQSVVNLLITSNVVYSYLF